MPSKETLKRALKRAGWAMVMGMGSAYISIPVNLEEPKEYIAVLLVGLLSGVLMGLQKFVSGYLKYDIKK